MNDMTTTNYDPVEPQPHEPTEYERSLPTIEWPSTPEDHAVNEGMWQRQCIQNYYNGGGWR